MHDKDGASFSKIYFCLSNAIAPMFLNRFLKVRCVLKSSEKVLQDGIGLITISIVVNKLSIFDEF